MRNFLIFTELELEIKKLYKLKEFLYLEIIIRNIINVASKRNLFQ